MKPEENSTNMYLKNLYRGNVVFEPDGNIPPDFLVNSVYAVEVRRLNQQFFKDDHAVGLEKLSYPFMDAVKEVLASYDSQHTGKSYWVNVYYRRPLGGNIRQVKSELQISLNDFLQSDVTLPCTIQVNENVELYIDLSDLVGEQVFRIAIEGDDDSGGGVISVYIQNIRHCIVDKSSKISRYKSRYTIWWLFLVDYMELGLSSEDTKKVISAISDLGKFDKVSIINHNGEFLLFDISAK